MHIHPRHLNAIKELEELAEEERDKLIKLSREELLKVNLAGYAVDIDGLKCGINVFLNSDLQAIDSPESLQCIITYTAPLFNFDGFTYRMGATGFYVYKDKSIAFTSAEADAWC